MKSIKFLSIVIFYSVLSLLNSSCSKSGSSGYGGTGGTGGTGTSVTVNMTGSAFSPSSLTVKTGSTVKWNNNDAVTHTATSDDGSTFDTGDILGSYSKSITVTKIGTFPYHCNHHAGMTGTLVVTN